MGESKIIKPVWPQFMRFVKENPSLIHLNMASTELDNQLLDELVMQIKRSISLQCVHLCNNNLSVQNM